MTTSTSPALRSRLQLALLNSRQKQKSLIQKGFTLVELMIVIVIVGVLSAIALPNFLSQKDKAYMTEAKQNNSAYLKQWYAANLESSIEATAMKADAPTGACPIDSDNFDYSCGDGTITATGKNSMNGKNLTMSINSNGKIITGSGS